MAKVRISKQPLKILDFDSECRPMHYSEWRPESQITGIAWSWVGEDRVDCTVLEQDLSNERAMLEEFLEAYYRADIVTGHYLRKHDLPLINDHCLRLGFPLISSRRPPILVLDTKVNLPTFKGLGQSQENLSVMLGVSAQKHHMTGADWRIANSLSPEGRAGTRKRVIDDVLQNKQLRQELLDRGALGPLRPWPGR